MNTRELSGALGILLRELLDGAPSSGAFMLNSGDEGLLRSLDKLSAPAASASVAGGAPISAHVDHVRYGFSLLNRWRAGEYPWRDADWTASWRIGRVDEDEWRRLRAELTKETRRFQELVAEPQELNESDLCIVIGTIAHLAYHFGAIRQIDRTAKGPSAEEEVRLKMAQSRISGDG